MARYLACHPQTQIGYNQAVPIRVALRNAEYFTVDERGNYIYHRGDLYATRETPNSYWQWQPQEAIHRYDLPLGDTSRYPALSADRSTRAANDAILDAAERSRAYHQQHPDAPYIEILELFELPTDLTNNYPPDAVI